ncbi:microtubule-associated protein futsch isoform X1 [Bactrocera oleae]|uniref:microtubule-associated protein futsch isoform X1 n=1 Tax=Bactrocera oleae TaxID=104688 RepID=UPI00387EB6C5
MDEIEYLEEYEDLILPTMSTQATTTKVRNRTNLAAMADDEDSSSIDQDIFDSLFDDNSDDESVMHKKGPAKLSQRSERSSRYSRVSMDSLDMLVKELGEPFNVNADSSKSTNRPQPKQSNIKVTQPNKTVQKSTTTTTMAKGTSSPTPLSSGSIKTNKTEATKAIVERNNKAKSVATVRPTVQQNLGQASTATKLINSNDHALPTTRTLQSSRSAVIQNTKITSASANSSKVASPTPSTSRKQISAATSTTGNSNNTLNSSKNNTPMAASKRIVERSQTTIIKPEKPQIKDPAEDPLSLENIENESDSDTDSFIYSDVSADTFVTLSDVDCDERHIIELSNDSNYERANLDKIRGSTPSPTVSDDYKSDKEDTPTKITSKFDETTKEGSVLERNANATSKFRVRQYVDTEATTSRERKQETSNECTNDKTTYMDINTTAKDTLLERIDTVLSVATDKAEELKFVAKDIDEVEPGMEVEVVTDSKDEAKDKKTDVMPESAIVSSDSQVDSMTIAKPGVIQEPSTTETMEMDMEEIVEEDVEKEKKYLDKEDIEKTIEENKEMSGNDNTTNEAADNNAGNVVMLNSLTTENVDETVHQIEVINEQVVETVESAETNENLNIKQSDTEAATNECNEREVNEGNADELQEAEAVFYDAVESITENATKLGEEDEVAQEKLEDETMSDRALKKGEEDVYNEDDESKIEKHDEKVLVDKDTEQEKFDLNTEAQTNAELQLQKHEQQSNIKTADTTTPTEETQTSKKYEMKNESSAESAKTQNENENEENCATSSKNAKELHETVTKMRGKDKQRVSLRRSQTPMGTKFTESKTQFAAKKPSEEEAKASNETKEDEAKADKATVEKTADDVRNKDKDRDKDATIVAKAGKLNEDSAGENIKEVGKRPQSSRNKSNTTKVDNKIDDKSKNMSKSNIDTEKTNSEMQRKSRYDKKEEVSRSDTKNERNERSQTPRVTKMPKLPSGVAEAQTVEKKEVGDTESSTTANVADKKKITKETTAQTKQHKTEVETHLEKCKTPELTARHDKRVRGLVVSLKKTDLSKVLNEKLLRKINTTEKGEMPTDLEKSETAANTTVDKPKIDSKEKEMTMVKTKGATKESTPTVVDEKDACVEKSAEERNKDIENTTEKAKGDIKHDKSKDKTDTARKDENSGDKTKRYSKYETHTSKSRRDRTRDKSVEKASEHTKSMKIEDKAEHSSKDEKSVIKSNKDSRLDKSADDTKKYSKSDKSTERSKRDSKYERSTERAKKDSKEENTAEKLKTDSKESTERARKNSREEKSTSGRKYENSTETEKRETKEKTEYKVRSDSKEERSKSSSKGSTERTKKGSNEEKIAEKTKTDSKESTEIPKKASKEEKSDDKSKKDSTDKSDDKSKRDSTDERSAEKVRSESRDSTHRTNKSSKEGKSTRLSRYDKSLERAKDEKTEVNANNDSKVERSSKEAKIDSKQEKSADRYRKVSKEVKVRSDSKEEKTSAIARSDSKEAKTSEKSKSDSKYETSTERVKKDSKNRESEIKATIDLKEEKSADQTLEDLEKTQESKKKSEDDKDTDYRKLKWKNEKYTRKTKSGKDTKQMSQSELNVEKETENDVCETKQSKATTSKETEKVDKKTTEQNAEINEKLNAETNIDSNQISTIQNCDETSDSKLEESAVENRKEDLEKIEEKVAASENVNTIQVEQNDKRTEEPTESAKITEEETTVTGSTEKAQERKAAIDSTDKSTDEGVVENSASAKYEPKRGTFYKTREKRVKRKSETKNEEESAVEEPGKKNEKQPQPETKTVADHIDDGTHEKKVDTEKATESSDKQEENKTEIVESNDVDKVEATTAAEDAQKVEQATKVDEDTTKRRAKSRRLAENTQKLEDTTTTVGGAVVEEIPENEREKTDTAIEKKNVVEPPTDGKAASEVVESIGKLENQIVDESASENLNKEAIIEKGELNVDEIEHNRTNAESLEKTVNTTTEETVEVATDIESSDKNTNANQNNVAKTVDTKATNETTKTHADKIEANKEATTEHEAAGNTEITDQPNKQHSTTQQTATTKESAAVESVKEPAATESGRSETKKHNRYKNIRHYADIEIISQSPQLLSADEDEHEGAKRRSRRTRAAEHSPNNKNENHKKVARATAYQAPTSALTNAAHKLHKEQPNSSRFATATPTTNLARKRMRDLTPNTTAENNELDKSPSKKLKWEPVRKSSRIQNDDVDTSEGEHGAKHFSAARESTASNKSAHEKQGKSTKGSKSAYESVTGVSTKHSIASEVKSSPIGDDINTSKTRDKLINTSHSANKVHTPEVKRKQEHGKLPTTATTTELSKKRWAELENAQQSAKKQARANDEITQQQKKTPTTHKSAVKQPATSSTGTPTAITRVEAKADHAHTSMAAEATDPLQLPVKRFKRLQAIDGYDTINTSEERKDIKAEELDNKNSTFKRKSLRAAGPTDGTKATETTNKLPVKQTQQSQQQQQLKQKQPPQQQQQQKQHQLQQKQHQLQQQQSQKAVASKQVEATTVSLKDRKIVVSNRTGKDAVSTDKANSSKSPTKSPGSKVITFKEWLEQQKKSTCEDGGEEVLFEPDESALRMDKILTAPTTEPKCSNTSVSEVNTSAEQKTKEPPAVQMPTAELSPTKSSKKKTNVRDATKRKRESEAASTSNKETKESVANELAKQTPPAAKQGRMEKVVTPTSTPVAAQFKRPSLPQRVSRLTPSRFKNRTPTQTDARAGAHSTQQHSRQTTLSRLGTKVKLRKLRVRINRSTVAAYFKNLNLNKVKEQVEENSVSISHSMTDIALSESVTKTTEPSQKRIPQKDPLAPAKESIVTQPTAATTTPTQLPTLTARPNVISAAEINDALQPSPVAMPALTKVPPSVEEKSPTKSQENPVTSQTEATDQQFGSAEELSLLTPMKCVTVLPTTSNSLRSQQPQQQQKQQIPSTGAEGMREKRASTTSSSDASITQRSQSTGKQANSSSSSTITAASSIANDTQLSFTPVVPKEELVDEHATPAQQTAAGITLGTSADNTATTNSLASRTLAIAAATNSALNQTPANDATGYYGLTPTQLDTNGTRLYSFLHPAKYNRNHGCVLLDYCCPNLDGPMPAIDPTRIHAQVQAGVRELPAYIVMSTKLITRADLEANKNVIPASIRQKVEKITADASNTNTPTNQTSAPASTAIAAPNTSIANVTTVPANLTVSKPTTTTTALTPTITALQKHLPSTTSIIPKLMPATSTPTMSSLGTTPTSATPQLPVVSDYQRSLLRTSVRQFDARLKKYYYRIAMLSFSERQTIIDGIINSTTLTPKDVDCAVRLIDEYAAQIGVAPTTSAGNVATAAKTTTPAIQSVSKAITTQTTNTVVRTTTIQQQSVNPNSQSSKTNQVAVLDKDNSLLGYQLAASPMPMNKSSISTRSSIMSSSLTGSMNTSFANVTTTSSVTLPTLKGAQASPRIFYTKPPMQTSTPIATTVSNANTPLNDSKTTSLRSTPRMGRELTIRQIPQKLNSVPASSTTATVTLPTRRLPTLTRNPHLTAGNSVEKSISETITTRSAVTITNAPKRMTRATAAAKVVVITQNTDGNNAPLDECILPDGHENTEIKREKVDDDFVGGN